MDPKVYLLAKTMPVSEGIDSYLSEQAIKDWIHQSKNAEELIEFSGRMCYQSFEVGHNPNISMVRKDSSNYLNNIIKSGHGSVLEHGWMTFAIVGVSRVFTHELVRHRVGTAFSQESLRYVRPKGRLDKIIDDDWNFLTEDERCKLNDYLTAVENMYEELAKKYIDDLPKSEKNFDLKKMRSSLFRRILPIGIPTSIVLSANLRTLRHLLEMRTARFAEIEIRRVFNMIGDICKIEHPLTFQDYVIEEVNGIGEWTTPNRKI